MSRGGPVESVGAMVGGGAVSLSRIPEWFSPEQRAIAEANVRAGDPWWKLTQAEIERMDAELRKRELIKIARLNHLLGYNPHTHCCENIKGPKTDPAAKFVRTFDATMDELTPLQKSGELMLSAMIRRVAAVVCDHLGEAKTDAIAGLLDGHGSRAVREIVADLIRERAEGQPAKNPIGLLTYRLRQSNKATT